MAGELGHMVVDIDGPACPCGRRGCLEVYASLSAARRQVLGSSCMADPHVLEAALERRNPAMTSWITSAARMLREAIVSIENVLDPNVVFIGGTVPQAILDALVATIEPLPARVSVAAAPDTARLLKARVGLGHATLGAAALPMFDQTAADISLLLK